MHDFDYVNSKETKKIKNEIISIIHNVQDEVRDKFSFRYDFVGSCKRNMITYDRKGNTGFDFDVNIEVNDEEEDYSAKEIKIILMNGFNKYSYHYGFSNAEDSTSVFTIKVKDRFNSRILYSCDFAIVYNCSDGRQQYIRNNKKHNSYTWEYRSKGFNDLPNRIKWLKNNNLWNEVRDLYIEKKNRNDNPHKHSRSIFAETINQVCHKYGYFKNNK